MANVHFFLQGKGGVGKSFCCIMYAQYLIDSGRPAPICIDTDPVNATFYSYKKLNVTRINILDGDVIDPLKFDAIIEIIAQASDSDTVIVDNGASSFIPFSDFLLSNDVPAMLDAMGHTVYIDTIITGGDALLDTVSGFNSLATQFDDPVKIVVWLNPYLGSLQFTDGRTFEEFKAYQDHKDKICGIISLPALQRGTFGFNLAEILQHRLTFSEVFQIASKDNSSGENAKYHFNIMGLQRLKIIQRTVNEQIGIIPDM